MVETRLAGTPAEVSALRAQRLLAGAEEMLLIGRKKKEEINHGCIGVALDAIHSAIGRSEKDARRIEETKLSLLTQAFTSVYGVRIRCPSHLFDEIKKRVPKDAFVAHASERERAAAFLKEIAKKLLNGHAGVWI